MDTKLCSEVISGLKRLGNSTLVSDEMFSKLLYSGTSTITQSELISANVSGLFTGSSKGDVVKEAHLALLSLFVEAAGLDLSFESLYTFLEIKMKWPKTRCKKLCDAYVDALPRAQAILSNIGVHPPHIVNVQWCLNHSIKSSSNEQTTSSVVTVKLETEGLSDTKGQDSAQFVCTLPELQDLVSKLKEALRQIERVSLTSNS